MCTQALTAARPARQQARRDQAAHRLLETVVYRWAWLRVSSAPACADSASSTAPTIAAHSG